MKMPELNRAFFWMALTFSVVMVVHWIFDMMKWAIGRYTETGFWASFGVMVVFSLLLTLLVEALHRWRSSKEMCYEEYVHHGHKVWVRHDLKGKHWHPTICGDCDLFRPNSMENCAIAQQLFELCKRHHIVLATWECPKFIPVTGIKNKGRG